MNVNTSYVAPVTIAVCATRDRARSLARAAFPRRRCRLALTRSAAEFERAFRESLVDAAVVDVHAPSEDAWHAVSLATEFPSAPFFVAPRTRTSKCAASIGLLTLPHQMVPSLDGSFTVNLSFGDRPVCDPVRQTSGPSCASWPSCFRMACS